MSVINVTPTDEAMIELSVSLITDTKRQFMMSRLESSIKDLDHIRGVYRVNGGLRIRVTDACDRDAIQEKVRSMAENEAR